MCWILSVKRHSDCLSIFIGLQKETQKKRVCCHSPNFHTIPGFMYSVLNSIYDAIDMLIQLQLPLRCYKSLLSILYHSMLTL
jgi:hypothetical protein